MPAADCTGTTELEVFGDAELAAPAGGRIGKGVPDGIITLSSVVPLAAATAEILLPEGGVFVSIAIGGGMGFTLFVGKEGTHDVTIFG